MPSPLSALPTPRWRHSLIHPVRSAPSPALVSLPPGPRSFRTCANAGVVGTRSCRCVLVLDDVELPELRVGGHGSVARVLLVSVLERRARHPGLEVLFAAPARVDEERVAVVARAQQLERLEAGRAAHLTGAGREAPDQLVGALGGDGDRV